MTQPSAGDDTTKQIVATFKQLPRRSAENAFPRSGGLADSLAKAAPDNGRGSVRVGVEVPRMFATAAIDIWLRGTHSLLVSASLADASPIWACVTSYYASHYSVRAFAHLLGHFQLHRKKCVTRLSFSNKEFACTFRQKTRTDSEHQFYWKVVKETSPFNNDPLFTSNNDRDDVGESRLRGFANYIDNLRNLPPFQSLNKPAIRQRLQRIAAIELSTYPALSRDNFPDLENSQLLAYHRIVRFRKHLDELLGTDVRFWSTHRQPDWVDGMLDFQLVVPRGMDSLSHPTLGAVGRGS